ncbi:hypothetical protein N665_2222s0009 [Sinapis alba]|nr:hypothetical protein N665_2222s0009 [Sinapis alba]
MAALIPILRPFFTSVTEAQPPISPRTSNHPHTLSRRDAVVSLSSASLLLFSLSPTEPAYAFGISGPKEWLKDQKKKSSRFLLAPIDASRESLRSVYLSLTTRESDYTDKDLESLQNLLRSSARDCVPKERSSLVDFQSKTGVEVCTFKLVLKNAASLLDDKDPVILKAEDILNDLVRSFGSLIVLTNGIDMNLPSDRKKIADAVMEAISFLDKFEKSVKDCLEI